MEENDRKDYFTFYVVLDGDRDFKANVTVQYGNAAGARPTTLVYNETVGGYAVQVADKETVRLIGLPAVDYLVTEEDLTEFNYNPVMQYNDGTITSKGPVRDAVVEGYTPVKVICTNKYPMRYGTLTIIKQIQGEIPANDDTIFVFHVAGTGAGVKGIDVSISAQDVKNGDTSVTIYKMPLGDYIITENTGWSWRYTYTDGAEKTTTIQGGDYGDYNKTVTFTNKLKNNKWLTDTEIEVNRFVSSSTK